MNKKYNVHTYQNHTFMPMLCSRTSIKDVAHPTRHGSSISSDPLSPKVGCTGQVKRNNKISGIPSIHHKLVITSCNNNYSSSKVKYFKLKKLFSRKNTLSGSSSPTFMICAPAKKCGVSSKDRKQEDKCGQDSENGNVMSVIDMDPPLPVIKKEFRVGNNGQVGENLWKRRCGGTATLRTIELQHLQLVRDSSQQPTTV